MTRYRRPHRWHSAPKARHDGAMIGPILIAVVLVIAMPVAVIMSGAVVSGLLGFFIKDDVDRTHEGSELLKTNI